MGLEDTHDNDQEDEDQDENHDAMLAMTIMGSWR